MASRVKESSAEIYREIERKIRADAEVRRQARDFADDVKDYWRDISPVDTGAYAASVHTERRPDVRGLPQFWVGTRIWYAHFVEFGTGEPGPTTEFAPAAKTAHHFRGTAP